MGFSALESAPWPVQLHLATVLPAFAMGTWLILFSRKGSLPHRTLGYIYLSLMSVTAVAALFIGSGTEGGWRLSPLHIFVPVTVFGIFAALQGAWTGNIRRHRAAMIGLYCGGLVFAGLLALLPGRLLNTVFFR